MQSLRSRYWFFVAQCCVFFKLHGRALEILLDLVAAYPRHPQAWGVAGFLLAENRRYQEAISAFESALAIGPDNSWNLFNLGFTLQKADRHEEAIERMQRAVELNPSLDRAWYGLGISLIHCGRFHEAIERLTEAARLQPFNPFARYQLAAAWFKLGRMENVVAEYRRLNSFDPKVAAHVRADFGVPRDPDEID
jgi:tetratricopeptide (TPR) repeat protein